MFQKSEVGGVPNSFIDNSLPGRKMSGEIDLQTKTPLYLLKILQYLDPSPGKSPPPLNISEHSIYHSASAVGCVTCVRSPSSPADAESHQLSNDAGEQTTPCAACAATCDCDRTPSMGSFLSAQVKMVCSFAHSDTVSHSETWQKNDALLIDNIFAWDIVPVA